MLFNINKDKPSSELLTKGHKYNEKIIELIRRRRLQMMVHSCIHYTYDESLIEDYKWDDWAMQLVDLQSKYPEESKVVVYYDLFKDWDGSTGAFLAKEPWALKTAQVLLRAKFGSEFEPQVGWML